METFREIFSDIPKVMATAHGRVNLIGEHTDYNGGFVLPTCIPQSTQVFLKARADNLVRVLSNIMSSDHENGFLSFTLGREKKKNQWIDYIQAVTSTLKNRNHNIQGFDCLITSDVPVGSGLSSSAALEVSLLKGLNELFHLKLDPITIAKYGQICENEFVGANVGIMDQMVISLGNTNEALFIDTKTLEYEPVPIPRNEVELLVINSGITHQNSQGQYNRRRQECEWACEFLNVNQLRDTNLLTVEQSNLPATIRARARHVVTENERVLEAVKAFRLRDYQKLGLLFYESQKSMRDDYEISTPEIDFLVNLVTNEKNVLGCRMTGAGFGGAVVAIVKPNSAKQIAQKVLPVYHQKTAKIAKVVTPDL